MLVKMLTEHGPKPTIVVWDAGRLGAQGGLRRLQGDAHSRPDLLKQQWPHLEPLVEAFGYRNVSVDGYEADDVIATIAERARDEGMPVMIVTGDRDAFQLIDPESRVKVMATARGITETKIYDRQAVIDRYGIPPELIPDFYGLKGDTSDNIPGVPGIGDKTAAELLQRFGDLETVLASVDEISGAKRKENLVEHAENARISKQLATIQREVPGVEIRPGRRSRASPTARGCATSSASSSCATRCAASRRRWARATRRRRRRRPRQTVAARVREGTLADIAAAGRRPSSRWPCWRPRTVEGELFAREAAVALRGRHRRHGARRRRAEARGRRARRRRPSGHRPRRQVAGRRAGQPRPRHAARRLPARARAPRLPVPRAVRGARPGRRRDDPGGGRRAAGARLAAWQREQIDERGLEPLMDEIELPLVRVLRAMEVEGVRLNVERLRRGRPRVRDEVAALEREIWELAGEEFTIGSPQQLGEILFDKLGLSRKRRGKTGFSTDARVLQAIRDEHEIIPKIERWRELNQLAKTYLDVLPQLTDERGPHPHDVPAGGRHDRPPRVDEPEHAERPGAHRAGPRDPRLLRGRRRATC